MNEPLNIVTVLRSGGDFRPEHVRWMQAQCAHYVPDIPFVCLSDVEIPGVQTVRMRRNWPGYWAKVEVFEHFVSALYMDLDTVLLGGLESLLAVVPYGGELIALRRFSGHPGMASGVMRWHADLSYIPQLLAMREAAAFAARDFNRADWGDQGFIYQHYQGPNIAYIQDFLPNYVQSYKRDLDCGRLEPHPSARILCFHGKPRPWDVQILIEKE